MYWRKASIHGSLSSFSIRSLSNPTIQRLPILITGTPVWPVLRTTSRAASGSRSRLTSLNGTRYSLKYRFARRHQEQAEVLNNTTLAIKASFTISIASCTYPEKGLPF